jgi:hypothetical protein
MRGEFVSKPTDRTFYPEGEILEKLGWESSFELVKTAPPALDLMLSFEGRGSRNLQRAIICRCYAGQRCSVTARETDRLTGRGKGRFPKIGRPDTSKYKSPKALRQWPMERNGAQERKKRAQNSAFVKPLWDKIISAVQHGIIVVAGATGSRKTTFARELARRHIDRLIREGRERPHIVTYEDPIESWFADSPEQASRSGFEYTPRQRHVDVGSLGEAVIDALRQKPALLYVNEVRSVEDWNSLLFFAGTGHLAITTTHAGSLIETFERILVAAAADTPAKRAEIASRIVAIVHVKKLESSFVPALWVQTARGRMALTQEGLGSLVPDREKGCFGRAHFAALLGRSRRVFRAAVKSDLSGE